MTKKTSKQLRASENFSKIGQEMTSVYFGDKKHGFT